MTLFNIPEAPRYSLGRAPLVQALAQVRYPLVASLETMAGIAPLQESLRDHFPYMQQEQVQEFSLTTGPAGPAAATASSVTWKMSDDFGRMLVIGSGTSTLSVNDQYTNVDDFLSSFRQLVVGLSEVVRVPRCDRIGIRFLSFAESLPGDARSWNRWFRDDITGWPGSEAVGEGCLSSTMTQTQLTHPPTGDLSGPPADIQATVRHGAVPEGTTVPGIPPFEITTDGFLVDLDLYVVGAQTFDVDRLTSQFEILHGQIDRFFYWILTESGRAHFGMEIASE